MIEYASVDEQKTLYRTKVNCTLLSRAYKIFLEAYRQFLTVDVKIIYHIDPILRILVTIQLYES